MTAPPDYPRITEVQRRLLERTPGHFEPIPEDVRPFNRTLGVLERLNLVDIPQRDGVFFWARTQLGKGVLEL